MSNEQKENWRANYVPAKGADLACIPRLLMHIDCTPSPPAGGAKEEP